MCDSILMSIYSHSSGTLNLRLYEMYSALTLTALVEKLAGNTTMSDVLVDLTFDHQFLLIVIATLSFKECTKVLQY